MGILDQKHSIFGNIAAARSLTTGLPQLKTNSSFPSVNNGGDTITFLTDLLKSLIGYQELQQVVENIISANLPQIERDIKNALKSQLKTIVNCGVNPSLPTWIKSTGPGIKFTVPQIDFTNLMFTDPHSEVGSVLYNNIMANLLDSTDFNTFLYQVIQNNGTVESWGHNTSSSDILTFSFKGKDLSGIDPNNTLTVKAHPAYDTKNLTDLNNNYVDSIQLFNAQNIMTNLIDTIFGSTSSVIDKSLSQLQKEAQVASVVNKIANANSKDVINDSYFTFTNAEKAAQQSAALARKNGVNVITTTNPIGVKVGFSDVLNMNASISGASNPAQLKTAVGDQLNSIGNTVAAYAPNPSDANTVKLNFIQQLVHNLTKCIVDTIMSPKVIAIFLINFKIVYGPAGEFSDPVDFLKKNRNLIQSIIKNIGASIIKILLVLALKEIGTLVAEAIAKKALDKNKLYVAQLLSMVGVPPEVLSLLTQLL